MFTIGLDYGSLSCRGIITDTQSGEIKAEAEYIYPHAIMTQMLPTGEKLPPMYALQHPDDYINAVKDIIPRLIAKSGIKAEKIIGIGIDFTASTVLPVDADFVPMCLKEEYAHDYHAWPKLWKHHGAAVQAEELNKAAKRENLTILDDYGGNIGLENYIPKVMEVCENSPKLFKATETFMECGDWISSYLAGKEIRSAAFLTCKGLWSPENGYPTEKFFVGIDEKYKDLPNKLMYHNGAKTIIAWPGEFASKISLTVAQELGLSENTVITAPEMDAYAGLPGCGICSDGTMEIMIGTSTAMMLLGREKKLVKNICASIENCILPGYTNYAHGQPSVGDLFDWFVKNCVPASYYSTANGNDMGIHDYLSMLASGKKPGETGLIALEWWNGQKLNPYLSGLVMGMSLDTKPEDIYRALIEATAFGAKKIIDNLRSFGVEVNRICASGGIAVKNPFLVQIYSDILGLEIDVCTCPHTAALGAAMFAAKAAQPERDIAEIISAMSDKNPKHYKPDMESHETYTLLYAEYCELNRIFADAESSMSRLKKLRTVHKANGKVRITNDQV